MSNCWAQHPALTRRHGRVHLSVRPLKRVEQTPEFSYPVYLVYPRSADSPALTQPIALLREVAEEEYDWSRWNYKI